MRSGLPARSRGLSALSRDTAVSVATIKFYLREGLLPPGEKIGPRQAIYGEEHRHRLRLIRTLVEIRGLSLKQTRSVLRAIDSCGDDTHLAFGLAIGAIEIPAETSGAAGRAEIAGAAEADGAAERAAAAGTTGSTEATGTTEHTGAAAVRSAIAARSAAHAADPDLAAADELFDVLGWKIHRGSANARALGAVMTSLRRLHPKLDPVQLLRPYGEALRPIVAAEMDPGEGLGTDLRRIERAVGITLLVDAALTPLRQLAQEDESRLRFAPPGTAYPTNAGSAADTDGTP